MVLAPSFVECLLESSASYNRVSDPCILGDKEITWFSNDIPFERMDFHFEEQLINFESRDEMLTLT